MVERSSSPQSIYLIFAIACGVLVANLYYAQPLLKPIGHDLSLPLSMTGLIVTMTQIGFVAGLLFLVPLFDRIENRRLILFVVTILIVALFLVGMSHNAFVFFLSSCLIGLGAVAAPLAGRWADKGHSKILTTFALLAAPIAYLSTWIVPQGPIAGLVVLYFCAIVLDMAVSTNLVVGQRAIYSLSASLRGRVNSVFMSVFFIGGAMGSAASGWLYTRFSWHGITVIGMLIPLLAFLYFLTEKKSQPSYGEGRDFSHRKA